MLLFTIYLSMVFAFSCLLRIITAKSEKITTCFSVYSVLEQIRVFHFFTLFNIRTNYITVSLPILP